MKRRKGLLAIVAALAISSVMAAMAYTSAAVKGPGTITVKSTTDSLLAFNPGQTLGNNDGAVTVENGELKFRPGYVGDTLVGLQPNTNYVWDKLFTITNNENHKVKVTVNSFADGLEQNSNVKWTIAAGYDIDGRTPSKAPDGTNYPVLLNNNVTNSGYVVLIPGETVNMKLDMKVLSGAEFNSALTHGTIQFYAEAIQ